MNTSTFKNLEGIDLGKLKELKELKGKNLKNPFLCYLNINSLRNKIVGLRYVLAQTGIELLAVSETKLSKNFPDAQFYVKVTISLPTVEIETQTGEVYWFLRKRILSLDGSKNLSLQKLKLSV